MKRYIVTSAGVAIASLAWQAEGNATETTAASDMVLAILSGAATASETTPSPADAVSGETAPAPEVTEGSETAPASEATEGADAAPAPEATEGSETAPAPEATEGSEAASEPEATEGSETAPAPEATGNSETETAPEIATADPLISAEIPATERILTRPGAVFHEAPSEDAKTSETYLPAYSIARVLKKEGDWTQVQLINGSSGWLKNSEILPWKHQMVIQFTAPTGRQRTLFFADKETALRYADMTDEERQVALTPVYEAINAGAPVADRGIVACEPDGWATMNSNLYLMPITEFEAEQSEIAADLDIRAIKVSAVTENTQEVSSREAGDTTGMTMDVVFVMDLSRSMRPIKEQVLRTINNINAAVSKNPAFNKDMIHFGFWGYRDNTEACQGIEYVTRNYTADGLLPADKFPEVLRQAEATPVDSIDYAEDVLAGVKDAINHTKWREGAARVIILIGDAPGREPGKTDPFCARRDKPTGTAANMGVSEIATLADENRVSVLTAYIDVARYREHLPIARNQFAALAVGQREKAASVINVSKAGEFEQFELDMTTWLVGTMNEVHKNKKELPAITPGQKVASVLFKHAKVRWLSEAHEVGITPDMSGWILDKDLSDSALDAVKPCVLLNRQQLDTMKSMMEAVVKAGERAQGTATELLTALTSVAVAGASDPDMFKNIEVLADSRFIPSFLKELPYHSKLMYLSNGYWQSMNKDEQDDLLLNTKNKIQFYEDLYRNKDLWLNLDENAPDDQKVVPVPFDMLP